MAGVPGPNSRYPQSPPPIWPLAGEDLAVFTPDRLFSDTYRISEIRLFRKPFCRPWDGFG